MRERWVGIGAVVALGAVTLVFLVVGTQGGLSPDLDHHEVAAVLAAQDPVATFGTGDIQIAGWYAELAGDCDGDSGGSDAAVAWLQAECPLRVLLPSQPPDDVTQAMLESTGLRLAAPNGKPFPSRAMPGGPNTRLGQLVFTGHFDDRAAASCVPNRAARCRATFVVTTYDPLVH